MKKGTFQFINLEGDLITFDDLDNVPDDFRYTQLVAFLPDFPDAPHTDIEHDAMIEWEELFDKYLEKAETDYE
jgi:hypothetical protein